MLNSSPLYGIAVPVAIFLATQAPMARGESYSPPMQARRWTLGSVPNKGRVVDGKVASPISWLNVVGVHNAEVHWYSPRGVVKDADFDPTLTDEGGAHNSREVLALSVPRRPAGTAPDEPLWVSLTTLLDPVAFDFTGVQAIEFWVNDWRDGARVRGPGLKLHVDLGLVSEDQMRAPNQLPNGRLDTEDRPPHDHVLVPREDTGIDGLRSTPEDEFSLPDGLSTPLDLVTASMSDPGGDDYAPPSTAFAEIDPRRWVRTNGTEGNRLEFSAPDEEDLDTDGILDLREDYFEYTIDLSDASQRYLVTDVFQEFAGQSVPHPVGPDNGWRRYRIPLDDSSRVEFGEPDLAWVEHLRIWVDGITLPDTIDAVSGESRPLLMLAGIEPTPDVRESIGSGVPNPFLTSTTFAYRLENPAHVRAVVIDLQAREIAVLDEAQRGPGYHSIVWDGRLSNGEQARAGVYFVRARFDGAHDRFWRVVRLK